MDIKADEGIPRYSNGLHGISWVFNWIQEILRDFKVFQGISKDSKGFEWISRDFTEFQRISWDNMGSHGIFKGFNSEVYSYKSSITSMLSISGISEMSRDLTYRYTQVYQVYQLYQVYQVYQYIKYIKYFKHIKHIKHGEITKMIRAYVNTPSTAKLAIAE